MLSLRPYKACDAEKIASWIKDEEAMYKWSSDRFGDFPITGEKINHKYIDLNGDSEDPENFYSMTAYDEDGIVGNLILRYVDENKRIIRLGFVIVDDSKRGKGYGKGMLKLALKFAFELLNADECNLGVFDNNSSAFHCYKSVGFEETGKSFEFKFGPFEEMWRVIELDIRREKYESLYRNREIGT